MWALDTSWLVAAFDADDEHHAQARSEAQEPGPQLVDPLILAEFLDGVRRHASRDDSLAVLAELQKLPHLRIVSSPKTARLERVMSRHGGISWFDAAAICTALDEGAGLRTVDTNQKKAFKAMA